jgi:hypothetical protein
MTGNYKVKQSLARTHGCVAMRLSIWRGLEGNVEKSF